MLAHSGDVAVIGAGVIGLAAAASLGRRGYRVTTFDPQPPGTGQSAGPVRAFRVAHPEAFAVEMAVRSQDLWRSWETRWGQPLIRRHGLLLCDPGRQVWADAMTEVRQPFLFPDLADAARVCPLVDTSQLDPSTLLFDPQAGAIDTRQAIAWLLAINGDYPWRRVAEHVDALHLTDCAGACVVTGSARHRFDAVVVAAGAGTENLAENLGLHLDTVVQQRTWAAMRPRRDVAASAMWMAMLPEHRYGWAQMGPDGAVALSGDWSSSNPTDTSAGSLASAINYAKSLLPVLDPATARRQEMLVAPVAVPGGKPFAVATVGSVTLIEGNQMFKFAPLIGELLADAVEGVAAADVPSFASVDSL